MHRYKTLKLKDGTTIDEHRHVMQQHLGRKLLFDEVVHHLNNDSRDNRLENLELTTRSKHSKQHWRDGTYKSSVITDEGRTALSIRFRGEGQPRSLLTEADVVKIRYRLELGDKSVDIAKDFGVSRKTIGSIKTRHTWKHI